MMKMICSLYAKALFLLVLGCSASLYGDNQTATVSSVYNGSKLPFTLKIELADFQLPNGIHSYASANYDGKWLFIAGRTNGLHDFNNDNNNFPPSSQNRVVYVVNPKHGHVYTRELTDANSGLTQDQVDYLSVTSPQAYQLEKTLYISGGYGVDTNTGVFNTKDVLSAVDIPGLMHWVMHPTSQGTAAKHIRQIHNPIFQVTGGYMDRVRKKHTLLIFGQNFIGYYLPSSNGNYTEQVRRFHIIDNGKKLAVKVCSAKPEEPNPNYRRRDLNIVPSIHSKHGHLHEGFIAYSGVFTLTDGVWTVPVTIRSNGSAHMDNPDNSSTFKQAMNQYACPTIGLYSRKSKDLYTIFPGGISFGYYNDGQFQTDSEIPFINQVTTIRRNKHGSDKQYLMADQYPTILSTQSNPGNVLLFGAGAQFLHSNHMKMYRNHVLKFDKLKKKTVIGYIVGGIQSTLPNTNSGSDSAASPYIFKVTLIPKK